MIQKSLIISLLGKLNLILGVIFFLSFTGQINVGVYVAINGDAAGHMKFSASSQLRNGSHPASPSS